MLEDLPDARRAARPHGEGLDLFGSAVVMAFAASGSRLGRRPRPSPSARGGRGGGLRAAASFWGAGADALAWSGVVDGDVDGGLALFDAGYANYLSAGLHTG
jgi:hypothetical protein